MIPVPPPEPVVSAPEERTISFTCWVCRTTLVVPANLVGAELACPQCQKRIKVPAVYRESDSGKTTITLACNNHRMIQTLPSRCICCIQFRRRIRWRRLSSGLPNRAFLLFAAGLLPGLIVLFLSAQMTVKLPLCDRHRYPWKWLYLFGAFFLVYMLVMPLLLIPLSVMAEQTWGRGNAVSLAILLGWFVGMPVFPVLALVAKHRTIHAEKITADSITLGDVSELFAEKVDHDGRR